jgi:RHS repeat-associated protein
MARFTATRPFTRKMRPIGKRIARRDANGSVHYYLGDHLGSTSMVVSAGGAIENESEFYPFGGELQFSAADATNHYKFTGKERDAETGLDYFGARYYGSILGRFASPDPEQAAGFDHMHDPQSWNGYAYARNNPLIYVDPDGQNYNLCDVNGKNCSDLTDEQYDEWRKQNPDVKSTASGRLESCSESGCIKIGSAAYHDPNDNALAMLQSVDHLAGGPVRTMGYITMGFVGAYGVGAAAPTVLSAGRAIYYAATGLLPAVPSALEKLRNLNLDASEANEIINSPTTQKLVDNANGGNINYIADVGGKLIRVTTDPEGQRIISAGIVRANSIANGIASGRFTPTK